MNHLVYKPIQMINPLLQQYGCSLHKQRGSSLFHHCYNNIVTYSIDSYNIIVYNIVTYNIVTNNIVTKTLLQTTLVMTGLRKIVHKSLLAARSTLASRISERYLGSGRGLEEGEGTDSSCKVRAVNMQCLLKTLSCTEGCRG